MNDAEKELDAAMGKVMEETMKPLPLRPVPAKPVSLSEQWTKLQSIEQELRNRVRREKMSIVAEFDRLLLEANADYDRRVDDAMMKLEADRRAAVQTLVAQMTDKLQEHERLTRFMQA